jgi:hypothetical protein
MLGKQIVRKSITLVLTLALFFVTSMVALAGTKDIAGGDITVHGQVSINGQTAVSNSTIVSGSSIVTAADSKAIIYLGKNGRIEILGGSSLTLSFTETSITGTLSNGNVRVANAPGVGTTLTTSNSTVIADSAQANTFSVGIDCADAAKCGETSVETIAGLVTLRNGSTERQIADGMDSGAQQSPQATPTPTPTPRTPGSTPPQSGIGGGALAALLLAAGGAIAAAILAANQDNDFDFGGNAIVISPTR